MNDLEEAIDRLLQDDIDPLVRATLSAPIRAEWTRRCKAEIAHAKNAADAVCRQFPQHEALRISASAQLYMESSIRSFNSAYGDMTKLLALEPKIQELESACPF